MKLIWSFNPFEEDSDLHRRAASAIEMLTTHGSWSIQPVVLVSQFSFLPIQAPCPSSPTDIATRVAEVANARLTQLTQQHDIKYLQPVHVILRRYHPLRAEVRELLDYAHHENADLIFTATRARTGWRRWLSGSFTESLIYLSDIPVFLLNPGCETRVQFNRIICPSEIRPDFEKLLPRIIQFASIFKSELVLFFRPIDQDVPAERVESWTELAKKAKISLRFRSDTSKDFTDSILEYAQKNAGLIVYCERSRQEDWWSLKRETRKIVLRSPCPVLVIYPDLNMSIIRTHSDRAA